MTILIAGGAGFIGSNLVIPLLDCGQAVVIADSFIRGNRKYLAEFHGNAAVHIIEADLANRGECAATFKYAQKLGVISEVWHLAANSDIPAGVANPDIDLKDTFLTTFEILRCMKSFNVRVFNFASSSAIYGDLGGQELHESIGPLFPISNYGAMKLASEAQASAAAESHLDRVNLLRFPNVVGVPATHGVILDFIKKMRGKSSVLNVLGDGTQQKAYLHVSDLIEAMLLVQSHPHAAKINAVNIGPVDDGICVRWIAEQVVARVNPGASIVFGTGNKGWVGDVPKFHYSTEKLKSFGWSPKLGSAEAVMRAIDEIATQEGV